MVPQVRFHAVVRHGQRADRAGDGSGRRWTEECPPGRDFDAPLTAEGEAQALATGAALKRIITAVAPFYVGDAAAAARPDVRFLSSPFTRTATTAALASVALDPCRHPHHARGRVHPHPHSHGHEKDAPSLTLPTDTEPYDVKLSLGLAEWLGDRLFPTPPGVVCDTAAVDAVLARHHAAVRLSFIAGHHAPSHAAPDGRARSSPHDVGSFRGTAEEISVDTRHCNYVAAKLMWPEGRDDATARCRAAPALVIAPFSPAAPAVGLAVATTHQYGCKAIATHYCGGSRAMAACAKGLGVSPVAFDVCNVTLFVGLPPGTAPDDGVAYSATVAAAEAAGHGGVALTALPEPWTDSSDGTVWRCLLLSSTAHLAAT